MTSSEAPHVLLTRAADAMQAAAGRWTNTAASNAYAWDNAVAFVVDDYSDAGLEAAHDWTLLMPPAVAPHLVAWLRDTARRCESQPHLSVDGFTPRKAALAFARVVLGMEAEDR